MKIRFSFNLALPFLAILFEGCNPDPSDSEKSRRATPVIVETVLRQSVSESLSLIGTIEANERVEIKAETLGIVESILFEEGQDVSAGEVLIALDHKKLEAAYEESVANLKWSEAELQRSKELFEDHLISQQDFDQAFTKAQSDRAIKALRERQLQDAKVIAPFSGVVGSRNVSPGQVITRDQTLTWLVDLDPLRVRFFVPERFLQVAQKGQKITIRVAAFPDLHFEGEVYFVAPFVDPETRNVEVKALVPNPDRMLIPGMFANLQLTLTIRDRALVISEMALFRTLEGDRAVVYVVNEDHLAETKRVSIGERMPGKVEVISGLEEGEKVIVEGTQKIGPGAPVLISFENETSNKTSNDDHQKVSNMNSDKVSNTNSNETSNMNSDKVSEKTSGENSNDDHQKVGDDLSEKTSNTNSEKASDIIK